MAHWFVSSHGNIQHKHAVGKKKQDVVQVPASMEFVTYCPDDAQLSMSGGWKLWDMLMFGENGGEAAAYAARYSRKRGLTTIANYWAYLDSSDFNSWDDGPSRGSQHPAKNAYGIWEVGNPSKRALNLKHYPGGIPLSDIFPLAVAAGVTRLYWGCCRAHVRHLGTAAQRNTTASNKVFTPSKLR